MPTESQLEHALVKDLRIPYRSFDSPTATDVMWQDGRNCYSNSRGYLERRPGFGSTVESVPTYFGGIQRIFTWRRWPGTANAGYYIMVSSLQNGVACVYKFLVGTDASAIKIWTSTSAEPFDFMEANNHCLFGNGTDMRKYDGETVAKYNGQRTTLWGIVKPASMPGVAESGSTRTDSVTIRPLVLMNGWEDHVGDFEAGHDQGHSWISGAASPYSSPEWAVDSDPNTSAYCYIRGSHQYHGVVWSFNFTGTAPEQMTLSIYSEVPANGQTIPQSSYVYNIADGGTKTESGGVTWITARSAGIWYSTDKGSTWTQVYNQGTRALQWDNFSLPAGTDINSVQVMAFIDSHDSMAHRVNDIKITGSVTSDVTGFYYRYTYGNSVTKHESSCSEVSLLTLGNAISVVASGDPQVDEIHVYRTTFGGSTSPAKMQELPSSPYANATATITDGQTLSLAAGVAVNDTSITVSGAASYTAPFMASLGTETILVTAVSGTTWTVTRAYLDTTAVSHSVGDSVTIRTDDTALLDSYCPGRYSNDPPPPSQGFIWAQNRAWAFSGNKLYYSGYEEIIKGVPEESWPSGSDGNYRPYKRVIHGLAPLPNGEATMTALTQFGVDGDTLDTFRWGTLLERRGTQQRATIQALGSTVIWLDTSKQVWNSDSGELGLDIRPDLESIDITQAAIALHIAGQFHWLILQDGAAGNLWVLNLDTNHWQVPWTVNSSAIHSGETADGVVDLLVGLNGTTLCKLTPATYTDNGTAYDAWVRTNPFDLCEKRPGQSAVVDYVEIERNQVALTDVLQMIDDNTGLGGGSHGTYTSIFANEKDPRLRGQGTYLVAKRYMSSPTFMNTGGAVCKRASFEFHWGARSTKFEFYGIDVAHHPAVSR